MAAAPPYPSAPPAILPQPFATEQQPEQPARGRAAHETAAAALLVEPVPDGGARVAQVSTGCATEELVEQRISDRTSG